MGTSDYTAIVVAVIAMLGTIGAAILSRKKQRTDDSRIVSVESRLTKALSRIDVMDRQLDKCESERKALEYKLITMQADYIDAVRRIKELEN